MFLGIVCNKVADLHLPVQLKNNSVKEIQNDGGEIPTDIKKHKRNGDGNNTTPVPRNMKQKEGMPDLWCFPETANFQSLFGNSAKGNAMVAKISEFKFRHHQKKNGGYNNTPLCVLYAVGQSCSKAKGCPKNHSQRKDLRNLATQREDVVLVDNVLKNHYK